MLVSVELSEDGFENILPEGFSQKIIEGLKPVIEEMVCSLRMGGDLPEEVQLSIRFCDEADIRDLNRSFLGEDAPTDVLAFPLCDADEGLLPPGAPPVILLGDIVICPSQVRKNADQAGLAFSGELALVTIHGLLHLFGMDHDEEESKKKMWETQQRYWDTIEFHLSS